MQMKAVHFFLAAALGFGAAGCSKKRVPETPPTVVLYEVVRSLADSSFQEAQTYLGNVRCDREMDLSFKVGGFLELIGPEPGRDWQEGDLVKQGQVLARLKQGDFESEVNRAQANADLESSQYERSLQLRKDGAISEQELDVIKAKAKTAQAALEQAKQAREDSVLRAPFEGNILARSASNGETVLPSRRVLRFGDLGLMSVELGVPDRVASRIRSLGMEIPVSINTLERTNYPGRIAQVGLSAQEGARLYTVLIKVDNTRQPSGGWAIKSGMTASVSVGQSATIPSDAVVVSLAALVSPSTATSASDRESQLAVFVVGDDNRVHERMVETGELIRSSVVVTKGLKVAEKVVVSGASSLHEGESVTAHPADRKIRR